MTRSLISALASLLLAVDVRAADPRWTVEFKEGARTFLTATGLEVGQKTTPGATIAGYLVVKLPADVDPATTNRGVFLGRVRVPERRVTWLKGDEFAAGALLPAQHLIAVTPNAGFEPGLWAVKVRDTVKDRNGRPVNPTNATWTVEIGEPRVRPDESGPARNTLKLKFTTEVDPATYADGIVVEKQVAGGWEEEPRGSATIAPREHGGSVNEIGLRPLGGWERGATYRVRVTEAIRDLRGLPLTNAEDFSFVVPKSGPFDTRHEPRRPVAQASAQAASAGPAFPGGQALGWHGHWTDPVTGLIYMRHRWYDPRTGTFLSPDPLEDIDSPNQYLFGAGRPHEVVDPLGLCLGLDKEGRPCGYYADRIDDYLVETAKLRRDRTGVPLALDRLLLSPVTGILRLGEAQGRLGYRYAEALTNPRVALPPGATVTSETNEVGADLLQAAGDAALLAPLTRGLVGMRTAASPAALVPIAESMRPSLPVLNPHFTPDPKAVLQNLATFQNARLAANPALAETVLTRPEYAAATKNIGIARMEWGNAVERLMAGEVREQPSLRSMFEHQGGPNRPDFIGRGAFDGLKFEVTTPGQVRAHLARPRYGLGLNVVTYQRPAGFTLFPPQ